MDNIIGLRVKIEYFDQNENFRKILPRIGTIKQRVYSKNGVNNLFLVVLDEPFDYQIKIGEPFQFKLLHCKVILIRSRWKDCEIGGSEEVSVFILLIPPGVLIKESIDVNNFYHVAWGTCSVIN